MENPGSPNNQAAAPTAVESERTPPPPPSTASALSWLGRSAARRIIPQKLIDWFGETDAAHNAGVVASEEQPAGDRLARDAGPPAHEDEDRSAMASTGPSSTHRAPNNSSNADNNNMAEDLARECIALTRGSGKLAISFHYGRALIYASKGADEKILYYVHQNRFYGAFEIPNEFKYADLESAVKQVRTYAPTSNYVAHVVLCKYSKDGIGIDYEEVSYLGRLRDSSNLTNFIQDKMNIFDLVNVETK
mmetsp:Transcript_30611/g.47954  ORF Transcript_30611/g.47954 Transcript_30611/m.47954 type:complete len:248 (+) Transcript_30611:405-1148(+)